MLIISVLLILIGVIRMKNRIKELRSERRVTQATLAKYLGVAQNTLSYWENETYDIDTGSLQKIADYFGVTTDYVLCRDSAPVSQPTADRTVSDEDIMFALFDGDKDITPEMFDEVKQFARFVRERHKK